MSSLKVSLVQAQIEWHQPEINLKHFDNLITQISEADLIVLPEMWVSGFTMKAHSMASASEPALELMKKWSLECSAIIIGSLITEEGERYYNRLYVVKQGEISYTYDKRHLFGYAGEDRTFSAGADKLEFNIKDWKVSAHICYDLRFPVWLRNTSEYDILLFCANWPDKRINAWRTLLKARAVENQSYVLGVNCFGTDAWKNNYSGHSAIVGFDGEVIETLSQKEGIIDAVLELPPLKKYRDDLPFLKDQDSFSID